MGGQPGAGGDTVTLPMSCRTSTDRAIPSASPLVAHTLRSGHTRLTGSIDFRQSAASFHSCNESFDGHGGALPVAMSQEGGNGLTARARQGGPGDVNERQQLRGKTVKSIGCFAWLQRGKGYRKLMPEGQEEDQGQCDDAGALDSAGVQDQDVRSRDRGMRGAGASARAALGSRPRGWVARGEGAGDQQGRKLLSHVKEEEPSDEPWRGASKGFDSAGCCTIS